MQKPGRESNVQKGECREKLVFGGVDGVVEEQEYDGEVDADFDKDVEDT